MPIGNGRLGSKFFRGSAEERLQQNEDTLWSGGPQPGDNSAARDVLPTVREAIFAGRYEEADRLARQMQGIFTQSYLPLGDLWLAFDDIDERAVTEYRRELSLGEAVATISFAHGGATFTREVFASAPGQAIFVRVACDRPGLINLTLGATSKLRHTVAVTGDGLLRLPGLAPSHVEPSYRQVDDAVHYSDDPALMGMSFALHVHVGIEGTGTVEANDAGTVRVRGADAVVLVVTAATSFAGFDRLPAQGDVDPAAVAAQALTV